MTEIFSQKFDGGMDFLDESDLESIITPIEGSLLTCHSQVLESDNFSDMYGQNHHQRKQKSRSRHLDPKPTQAEQDLPDLGPDDLKEIYNELQTISNKLKKETQILHEREQKIKEREHLVAVSQSNLQTIINHEVKEKMALIEEKYNNELTKLEKLMKDKMQENRRLKENFETMKQANDVLKKEMETLCSQHEKLERQASSVNARLANLQRKQEFEQRQKESDGIAEALQTKSAKVSKDQEEKPAKPAKIAKLPTTPVYDILSSLLDWVCDAHLRQAVTDQPTQPAERFSSPAFVQEKIYRVLPALVDILRDFQPASVKFSLPCLQFVYWSLLHVEQSQGQLKANLSSTLRRLGEEIYRVRPSKSTEAILVTSPLRIDKPKDGLFFRSSNLHVRLLSSFIILKTLTQVDLLAHVFDSLKSDLKLDMAKELFLYYQATCVIFTYLKPVNKVFLGVAVDLLLQMATESPFMQPFLESCSRETCFRTLALLLRSPIQDVKVLERLSIILQKLSKIKSNRRYFEIYTIGTILQEILQSTAKDNSFLSLNLKSVLFNLGSGTN